jgi:hypothetical protein
MDSYIPSGTLCSKCCGNGARRDEPQAGAHGDALIGGETATDSCGNERTAAVAQQDVAEKIEPWAPWPRLLVANIVSWTVMCALMWGLCKVFGTLGPWFWVGFVTGVFGEKLSKDLGKRSC